MTPNDAPPTTKFRVLIADDFQETRRSIRLMLSMNPDVIVVAIARDGFEAVEMAREHHPDILVMDINMPRIDGLAAFKEINRIQPGTGCVIVTGQRETGPLDMAMTLGVYEYLLKPFNIEELNNAVNRVAAQLVEKRVKFAGEIEQLKNEAAQLAPSQLEAPAEHNEEEQLKTLAAEYAKTRRTDDEGLAVFDKLAQNPACELRWLRTLAMLYVIRQDWDKLQTLSARLYQQAGRQVK